MVPASVASLASDHKPAIVKRLARAVASVVFRVTQLSKVRLVHTLGSRMNSAYVNLLLYSSHYLLVVGDTVEHARVVRTKHNDMLSVMCYNQIHIEIVRCTQRSKQCEKLDMSKVQCAHCPNLQRF
jgi:hypothetical protein